MLKKEMGITAAADGRRLEGLDTVYFNSGYALSGVMTVQRSGGMEQSDKKLIQAFDRVIKTTPILQTQILDDGKTFEQVSPDKWPRLQILDSQSPTDEELMPMARIELDHAMAQAKELEEEGGEECRRRPVMAAMILRSPSRLAWMIAAPHHFCDGPAIGVIFVKFCQYARLPKALWPVLDRFSDQGRVPTFYEMGLKSDYPQFKDQLENLNLQKFAGLDKRNFCFSRYNMDPFSNHQCVANSCLPLVPPKALGDLRKALRSQGLTITSAFGALAVKVMAGLLKGSTMKESFFPATSDEQENMIAASIPMDMRNLGKWNDRRDKRKKFPEVASFPFSCVSQVTLSEALDGSVDDIGHCVKKSFDECRNDAETRAIAMRGSCEPLVSHLFVGCSSIILPRGGASWVMGLQHVEFDCKIKFGPLPRVWFYVLTSAKGAQIDVDISLPIEGYPNESEVISIIREAARDSCLESIL